VSFRMDVKMDKTLEDGAYHAKLRNVEQIETKFGDRLMWTFEILGENTDIVGFTSMSPSVKAKAYEWAATIAGAIDAKLGWGPEDVIGGDCVVVLETAEDDRGFKKNKIVKVNPLEKANREASGIAAEPDDSDEDLIQVTFS
jgi:hypothetical protein